MDWEWGIACALAWEQCIIGVGFNRCPDGCHQMFCVYLGPLVLQFMWGGSGSTFAD